MCKMINNVNIFEINENTLYIMCDGWDKVVETTYREDCVDEIKSHVWSLKKRISHNATLGGGLHRYIMEKWYGKEMLEEMTYIDGICTTAISDTDTEDFKSLCPQCAKKYAEDEAYIGYELS